MDQKEYKIDNAEIFVLRELAKKIKEISANEINISRKKKWTDCNDLKQTRAMIFCDPENSWKEIIKNNDLKCTNKLARSWEYSLLKRIFWGEKMGCDIVTEPKFSYSTSVYESDWGLSEKRIQNSPDGSYKWESPIKSYDDLNKLKFPEIVINHQETELIKNLSEDIFGDILHVYRKNYWWWSLGLTYQFAMLRGMENMMYDMYDSPDDVHKLMKFLMDGTLAKLSYLENENLLSVNSESDFIGSHSHGFCSLLPDSNLDKVTPEKMWGFFESQETVGISPEMFAEFIFPYQLEIAKKFGLNYYGCCEPLDKRFDIITKIPRLRKISVSAWANLEIMSEFIGTKYVMSIKPNPTFVATHSPDWNDIRNSLRKIISLTKNNHIEIILKDLHTLHNDPDRVIKWCRIALEEAENNK